MKLLRSLALSSLLAAPSAAFAAPVTRSLVDTLGDTAVDALRVVSSVCLGNVDIAKNVTGKYRYGTQGEWKDVTFEKNSEMIFSERYTTDIQPLTLTVKFLNRDGADAQEMTYDLSQTETRLVPKRCDNIENYRFQKTDAAELTVDLVHISQ